LVVEARRESSSRGASSCNKTLMSSAGRIRRPVRPPRHCMGGHLAASLLVPRCLGGEACGQESPVVAALLG
jgi:hypothetical protein